MAKKSSKQSAQQQNQSRQSQNRTAQGQENRQPGRGTADNTKTKRSNPTPQQASKPKRSNRDTAPEAATPGSILWKLALILCMGLVVFSLLFASVNGGSRYIGLTNNNSATPTPPVVSTDPNQTVTGSDATPIPPSPTPGIDPTPTVTPESQEGGTTITGLSGQTVTQ